jgi:hypothetical protein
MTIKRAVEHTQLMLDTNEKNLSKAYNEQADCIIVKFNNPISVEALQLIIKNKVYGKRKLFIYQNEVWL